MPVTPLLTDNEASELLRLSRAKFHQLVARGLIPRVKIGRAARYRHEDVEAFIQSLVSR